MAGSIPYRNAALVSAGILAFSLMWFSAAAEEPAWKALNDKAAQEKNVKTILRNDIPETGVVSNLEPGAVINRKNLPDVAIAPGVTGKMYWGKGTLINWMTMEPGAEIPREKLPCERLMVVWKGSVEQLLYGKFVPMSSYTLVTNWTSNPHRDFVYLPKFEVNAMRAGRDGAEILEIYSPVRLDYVQKAGGKVPASITEGMYHVSPAFPPNKVLNFYDVQFTDLSETTSNSRLISGRGFQCSFLSVDPGRVSPFHNHPEEQVSIVLRGYVNETLMDKTVKMQEGDIVYMPSNMVHRGEYGAPGCDFLDVFWPPRPDFLAKMNDRLAKFHSVIPKDARPVLVHDGEKKEPFLTWTEGPAWMNGRFYFSNMWFEKGFTAGSPEKSNTIRMEKNGTFTIISRNMQTNGIMPLGNGNLAVCDMFGHRVIEMNPDGRILRTLADKYNGVRFDGPNDLVIDAKGGIYITDPQFTPGLDKTQPGKSVFYRKPDGEVIRVVAPGEFGQENGILLSPDGKTCFINNTRNMPVGNYVMAFDVNPDGALSNGRPFAKLFVPPEVRAKEDNASGADGMKIDVEGNLYVCTLMGLQIFDKKGQFLGIVDFPMRAVNCVFGGNDLKTLYLTCVGRIYSIKTNVKGLEYPLKK
ncbi:MAG: SMP-30/gluconolactonase/LRE family protein [Candidatus Latescibacter sp.]|nr:SMP-30/gluconolactonase/LRE family protein [Candidatus Latescibacter sp.]